MNENKGQRIQARRPADRTALWLVPLSCVIALVLVEGVLRLYPSLMPEEVQLRMLWGRQGAVQPIGDPYLGYVYPPHLKARIGAGKARFEIVADEHGFRNPSPWPERASVVIVGDSLAYGWGLTREESWIALLEKELDDGPVVTLGLPGTVPQQYLRYLETFGLALEPEIVIFTIFSGNDFVDAMAFDSWSAAGSPGSFGDWRNFGGDVPSPGRDLIARSYLLAFLKSASRSLRSRSASRTMVLEDDARLVLTPSILRHAVLHRRPDSPGFRSVLEATLAARDLAESTGSRFVVLLFPTREEIYLPLVEEPFPSLFGPFKEALERESVEYIDLATRFGQLAARKQKLYFTVDTHPNAYGNEVVAKVVADRLRLAPDRVKPP